MSATLALPAWLGAIAGTSGAVAGAVNKNDEWYDEIAKWLGNNLIEKPTEQIFDYLKNLWGGRTQEEKTPITNTESNKVILQGQNKIPSAVAGGDVYTGGLFGGEKIPIGEFEKAMDEGRPTMASLGLTATPEFNAGNNGNDDEEKKEQIGNPIIDTTTDNVEEKISSYDNIDNYLKMFQEEQQKYIDLQEKWRKEDQERADTAYSRAIKDMYRSGIDPNQIGNVTPAEVGGQIQQPFNGITTGLQTALSKEMEVLQTMIEQSFKGDENDKDRFTDIINKVIGAVAVIGAAKGSSQLKLCVKNQNGYIKRVDIKLQGQTGTEFITRVIIMRLDFMQNADIVKLALMKRQIIGL